MSLEMACNNFATMWQKAPCEVCVRTYKGSACNSAGAVTGSAGGSVSGDGLQQAGRQVAGVL